MVQTCSNLYLFNFRKLRNCYFYKLYFYTGMETIEYWD